MSTESIINKINDISDGGNNTAAEFRSVLTEMTSDFSGATSGLTEHTSDDTIHFEQSGITITEAQISDLKPYLTGYTETDTLDSITSRGNVTTNDIQIGALSAHTVQLNNLSGETGTGVLSWNEQYGTAELGLRGGNVRLQLGQETHIFVRADVDLNDGDIVYYTGIQPDPENPRIKANKYIADNSLEPVLVLGVVTEPISANAYGFITTFGIINGLDTTGNPFSETWNEGDILYASPTIAGQLTNIEPLAPNLRIKMAIVIRSHVNFGTIMVRPTVGLHISDLHDVSVSGITDGDYLKYNYSLGVWENAVFPTTSNGAANLTYLSDNFTKNTQSWNILSGDDVETAFGKVSYALDRILLQGEGLLNVIVEDGSTRINGFIEVRDSNNSIVYSGDTIDGVNTLTLPAEKYSVTLIALGYDILESTTINDNDLVDNTLVGNTCTNVDVGGFDTTVTFKIKPTYAPTLNSFTINEGALSTSNKDLRLNIDTTGIVSEISISRLSGTLGNIWVPYTGGDYPYEFNYISEITLTLFIKVRNSTGESSMLTTSIDMVNGISRSDNSVTYNLLSECISDIILDYPSGLTENVIVEVNSEVYNQGDYKFISTLKNFNENTPFYLHIKGNDNLTLDCDSTGGFRMDYCENIIFSGIKFTNVSNYNEHYVPELMCAIYSNKCNNIMVNNCTFDGLYTPDITKSYGRYAIVVNENNQFTISESLFTNFGLTVIDVSNTVAFSFLKSTITNCPIIRGLIGQPSHIELNNVQLLKIEDCILDGTGMDTIISGLNVVRTYINRTTLSNCPGEILSLSNTRKCEILSIKNCIIKDNLSNPYYYWTKQNIEINDIDLVEFINNTIKFTAVGGNNLYARLIRAITRIGEFKMYNNVIDYSMPTFVNNASESAILQTPILEVLNSDNNLYRDYTLNNDSMINILFIITDENSPVYTFRVDSLTKMRALGGDINSTLITTSVPLFINNNLRLLEANHLSLPYNELNLPSMDIDKLLPNVIGNIGCSYSGGTAGLDVIDIEYVGLYLLNGGTFQETDIDYIINSGSGMILSIDKYNDEGIFVWTFNTLSEGDTILIGTDVSAVLNAKLTVDGTYIEDNYYSLKIEKI